MPKTRKGRSLFYFGLVRVGFPRVEVKNIGILLFKNRLDNFFENPNGYKPEIGAPARRHNVFSYAKIAYWKLMYVPVCLTRNACSIREYLDLSVSVVSSEGIEARIVRISTFFKYSKHFFAY